MNMESSTAPSKRSGKSISVWDLPCYTYSADCGSIMTGTDRFFAHHSNGYGDCSDKRIFLLEDYENENPEEVIMELLRFSEMVEGVGYVYNYDVPGEACPMFELNGKYMIYLVMNRESMQPTGNMLIHKVG